MEFYICNSRFEVSVSTVLETKQFGREQLNSNFDIKIEIQNYAYDDLIKIAATSQRVNSKNDPDRNFTFEQPDQSQVR